MSKATNDNITQSGVVIMAADRFVNRGKELSPEALRQLHLIYHPSFNALPFVTQVEGANDFERPLSFWGDVPTDDHLKDHKRGREYANLAVAAILADKCGTRPLERTFEAIIKSQVARKAKGGKNSRTLPSAVDGFLWEFSKLILESAKRAKAGKAVQS